MVSKSQKDKHNLQKMQQEEEKEITDKQPKNRTAEHLKPYQWKKGQSGNYNGRPKNKTIPEYFTKEEKEELMNRYKEEAKKNPKVLMHLVDQLHGKAKQTNEIGFIQSISDVLNEIDESNDNPKTES